MIFVVMAMNIITTCRCTSKLHISYDFCINLSLVIGLFLSWGKNHANPHSVDHVTMNHYYKL